MSIIQTRDYRGRFSAVVLVFSCMFLGLLGHVSATAQSIKDVRTKVDQDLPRIHFIGLRTVSEKDLRRLLRERLEVSIEGGSDADSMEVIRQFLHSYGYMDAVIMIGSRERDEITFTINQGARYRINEIKVQGSRAFSPNELSSRIAKCLRRFGAEDGYNAELFSYCLRDTSHFLSSQGYMKAEFLKPVITTIRDGLLITVAVTEGERYRLGQLKIEGATVFPESELQASLALRQGEIVDTTALSKWLFEEMSDLYGARGYISYTADIEPEYRPASEGQTEPLVDLKVTIDEGPQFKIESLKLEGADNVKQSIEHLMPIRSGDIFNRAQFNDGIVRLNELGLFAPIDRDRDVSYETDHERGIVRISIQLNPTAPTSLTKFLRSR